MSALARARERLVAWLRAATDYVWDNPTAEHDARAILVGPKVGLWLGLELLVVLAGAAVAFLAIPAGSPALRAALAELGPGTYLIAATQASLALFLTLVVPLRAVGLLEGPRWRGYLDQLVTTGITPWRYYAGKWASTQPFLLALLAATLPLTVLFAILGGIDLWRALGGYALLWAYGNLLLAVSLGLGVVLHELVALLVVWLGFAGLTVLDYTPCPGTLAAWTPHRFLLQPFAPHLAGTNADLLASLFGQAHPLGLELPWAAWALLLWSVIGLAAAIGCAIGPLHAFTPGLNNFGAVVLPGDRARTILRRVRPMLARRVELAFLFENRGPRLVRWTLPLRALQQLLVLGLLAVMLPSATLDPALIQLMDDAHGAAGLHLTGAGLVLLAALVGLSTGRSEGQQLLALGRHRVPLLALDAGVFLAVCGLLLLGQALAFAGAWETLEDLARLKSGRGAPEELFAASAATLAAMIASAAATFLVGKSLAGRLLGRWPVLLLSVLYLLALVLLPLFALGLSGALAQAGEDRGEALALVRPLWALGQASPLTAGGLAWAGPPPWLEAGEDPSWLLTHAFWLWTPLWIALLLPRVLAQGLATHDVGLARERRRRGEAPPPAARCPRCPMGEGLPQRWTWWGGLFGPRLLRYAACLDCGATWSTRTGRTAPGGVLLVVLVRLLAVALVTAIVAVALAAQLWGPP